MRVETLEYKAIDERMHIFEHSSGLKTFVIPKKGYSKKYAAFATDYGSVNNAFVSPGDDYKTVVPDGIAHFLEHKLFEQKDGSVMDKFSKLGSSPNAYTSFAQTVYLFSCTDMFNENLSLLIDFVQNPWITDESVEREKGIIGQEIKMYQDNAEWRVFFNLLGALYKNNPVKKDIAGTIESISKINKDILYKCYNTFYHPSNMVILVVGDVEPESVFEQVEKGIIIKGEKSEIQRIFPDEPQGVNRPFIEQEFAIATPLFQLGFKDHNVIGKGFDCLKREVAVKLLLDAIMGRSSELFNSMYNEGLVNNTFEFDYSIEKTYAYSLMGGESNHPEKVKDKICSEILRLQQNGLDDQRCERIKRAMKGRFIKQLNSVERMAHTFMQVYFKDTTLFDYLDVYDKINFEYLTSVFEQHFNVENLALSLIRPHSVK